MAGLAGLALLALVNLGSFRGVWIPRWSLSSGFGPILADLQAGQFNHCFIQIYALGETYYPSRLAPNRYLFSDAELKKFIRDAHASNIKVHAWLNLFYAGSAASWNTDPAHLLNRQPGWFTCERGGRPILDFTATEIERAGLEGYYLAPANYWVKDHLKSIVTEVVKGYDFDGIHLDYVRYPGTQFAYDPATRTVFARRTYVDPEELNTNYDGLAARFGSGGLSDLYRRWFDFLIEDLSVFIYQLNIEIKQLKPNVYLSAAVKPDPRRGREEYLQDWAAWINRGYIDFVCLMAYTKNLKPDLDRVERDILYSDRVMVGLGLYIQSPEALQAQVDLLRSYDFGGVVFFSYDDLRKNRGFIAVGP